MVKPWWEEKEISNILKTEKDIVDWINEYALSSGLNINADMTVSADQLQLKNCEEKFKRLPIKLSKVNRLYIYMPSLETLEGCPNITSYFYVHYTKIKNLIGGPKKVIHTYSCASNELLVSLKGAPNRVISFDCSNCSLQSLKYVPRRTKKIICANNRLVSIKSVHIVKYLDCRKNVNLSFYGFKAFPNTWDVDNHLKTTEEYKRYLLKRKIVRGIV